jgi:NAD(P)-dependent dehydrogenase (short-subunit alcohol dehydrogenase family)
MTFQPDIFSGKLALVTGATTGIGAGIASALAHLGAEVVAVGLGADRFQAPADLKMRAHELDVCDETGVRSLIDGLDRLDIVVNCAGVIRRQEEHQLDVFEKVLAINLTGTMRVCTAAREKLAASKGAIVNTASMLSFFGGGLVPAYSASKGGVAQLTKSLAIAYAPDGIRVNAVAPGWIATPLTQALQDDPVRSGPIIDRTPLKRWGKPEDIAGAVAFLCSPAASFITGIVMPIDGGYLVA